MDTAVGVVRSVLEAAAGPSTDAYISAASLAVILIILIGSVAWGTRTGRLDVYAILESVTRPEIAIPCELLLLLGDMIAFTVGVKQEVFVDPRLAEAIPASVLALVVGWSVTLYHFLQLGLAMRSYIRIRRGKRHAKMACEILLKTDSVYEYADAERLARASDLEKDEALSGLLYAYGKMKQDTQDTYLMMLYLFFADLPLLGIATYIIMIAGASDMMVVAALILSAMAIGSKGSKLGSFSEHVKNMRTIETAFVSQLYVRDSWSIKRNSLRSDMRTLSQMLSAELDREGQETFFEAAEGEVESQSADCLATNRAEATTMQQQMEPHVLTETASHEQRYTAHCSQCSPSGEGELSCNTLAGPTPEGSLRPLPSPAVAFMPPSSPFVRQVGRPSPGGCDTKSGRPCHAGTDHRNTRRWLWPGMADDLSRKSPEIDLE
eukprot:TRINITY_DN10484_c0_g1_i1.p1 TRINITY_DN10484_c0_g1~~TRINITY_DN10484_c0_g1_i1.p1  ORF type:complete len:447 (-),score=29.58 TRINITY_DN10484_c0_g1_i1:30-1337(-)